MLSSFWQGNDYDVGVPRYLRTRHIQGNDKEIIGLNNREKSHCN